MSKITIHQSNKYAFGLAGDEDLARWSHYLGFWLSVEGRDLEKLVQEARGKAAGIGEIPDWVLATQTENVDRSLAERRLRQAQKFTETLKPVGALPEIPEELLEIAKTVTLPGGERIPRPKNLPDVQDKGKPTR